MALLVAWKNTDDARHIVVFGIIQRTALKCNCSVCTHGEIGLWGWYTSRQLLETARVAPLCQRVSTSNSMSANESKSRRSSMRAQRCQTTVYANGKLTELQRVGHQPLKRNLYSVMTQLCVFAHNTTATQNKLNNKSRLCNQNMPYKAGFCSAERETSMPYCGWRPF